MSDVRLHLDAVSGPLSEGHGLSKDRAAGWRSVLDSKRARRTLLFLLSVLLLVVGMGPSIVGLYDEGLVAYGGWRVSLGEWPYRDFWTLYSPGQFWVLGALFKVIEPSIWVERLWDAAARAGVAVAGYVIVRDIAGKRAAAWCWLALLGVLWFAGSYGYPAVPALLFALIALRLWTKAIVTTSAGIRLVGAGIATGVVFLFRHDFGVYTMAAMLLTLIVATWTGLASPTRSGGSAAVRAASRAAVYGLGAAAVLLPVGVVLLINVSWQDIYFDLWKFPAEIYPKVRGAPLTLPASPLALIRGDVTAHRFFADAAAAAPFIFTVAVLAVALVVAVLSVRGRMDDSIARDKRLTWLALGLLGTALLSHAAVRYDMSHILSSLVIAIMLGLALWERFLGKIRGARIVRAGLVVAVVGAMAWVGTAKRGVYALAVVAPDANLVFDHGISAARFFALSPDRSDLLRYVIAQTPANGYVFSAGARHDCITANDIMFYFLSRRRSPTKYHELHPGLVTTAPIQRQIVADLGARDVDTIVVSKMGAGECAERRGTAGAEVLDRYIDSQYSSAARFGAFDVLKRRGNHASLATTGSQ